MSTARLILRLMQEVEVRDHEIEYLRVENDELRALAFGEVEYFEALAARWANHLRPRDAYRGQQCRQQR